MAAFSIFNFFNENAVNDVRHLARLALTATPCSLDRELGRSQRPAGDFLSLCWQTT
jgi:hypothetical protein